MDEYFLSFPLFSNSDPGSHGEHSSPPPYYEYGAQVRLYRERTVQLLIVPGTNEPSVRGTEVGTYHIVNTRDASSEPKRDNC